MTRKVSLLKTVLSFTMRHLLILSFFLVPFYIWHAEEKPKPHLILKAQEIDAWFSSQVKAYLIDADNNGKWDGLDLNQDQVIDMVFLDAFPGYLQSVQAKPKKIRLDLNRDRKSDYLLVLFKKANSNEAQILDLKKRESRLIISKEEKKILGFDVNGDDIVDDDYLAKVYKDDKPPSSRLSHLADRIYTEPFILILTCKDNTACDSIAYSWNLKTPSFKVQRKGSLLSKPPVVRLKVGREKNTQASVHTLKYRFRDINGNLEPLNTLTFKIDSSPAKIKIINIRAHSIEDAEKKNILRVSWASDKKINFAIKHSGDCETAATLKGENIQGKTNGKSVQNSYIPLNQFKNQEYPHTMICALSLNQLTSQKTVVLDKKSASLWNYHLMQAGGAYLFNLGPLNDIYAHTMGLGLYYLVGLDDYWQAWDFMSDTRKEYLPGLRFDFYYLSRQQATLSVTDHILAVGSQWIFSLPDWPRLKLLTSASIGADILNVQDESFNETVIAFALLTEAKIAYLIQDFLLSFGVNLMSIYNSQTPIIRLGVSLGVLYGFY